MTTNMVEGYTPSWDVVEGYVKRGATLRGVIMEGKRVFLERILKEGGNIHVRSVLRQMQKEN